MSPTCPLCGSTDISGSDTRIYNHKGSQPGRFFACRVCEAEFLDPEEWTADLYADRDSPNYAPPQWTVFGRMKEVFLSRSVRRLLPQRRDARILDYGCGGGELANALLALGFLSIVASDLQSDRPSTLRPRVTYHPLADLTECSDRFDVVILRHVLEHTSDPRSCLQNVREALADGGRAIVEVPNPKSLFRTVFKGYWPGYFYPYHRFLFSQKSILSVAKEAGLAVVEVRPAEPPIAGVLLMTLGVPRRIAKALSMTLYPAQTIASHVVGSSEAISYVMVRA